MYNILYYMNAITYTEARETLAQTIRRFAGITTR